MNRLIILGNGFDLAHGLKTKYSDFIGDYWSGVVDSSYKDDFFEFLVEGVVFDSCRNLKSVRECLDNKVQSLKHSEREIAKSRGVMKLLNNFFYRINEKYDETNWVDIEMEYYFHLCKFLNSAEFYGDERRYTVNVYNNVLRLNKNLEQIIRKFDNYLKEKVVPETENCYCKEIADVVSDSTISRQDVDQFYEEFPKKFVDKELNAEFLLRLFKSDHVPKFSDTLILNFNYTNTISLYLPNAKIINIHGKVADPDNPINIGFGDEKDKNYNAIEDHNRNEYLKYMKSFYYSNNKNYKELFDFIETGNFQAQIMGHSCGLSDRTLLNSIFEHGNCKSIKVYYHKYLNSNNQPEDNYSEIIKNISRHFNQKALMREKIVSKVLCEPLPQIAK